MRHYTNRNNTMTVMNHLRKHGSITPAEALIVHKIARLAPRVLELRKQYGMNIATVARKDEAGDRYFRYELREGTSAQA